MASGSGARALSVGVAPGCAGHVTGRRKWRREWAGSGARVLGAVTPFSPLPPFPARPSSTRSAFPHPRSAPRVGRAAPALRLPFLSPRCALKPACLVGWGRPSPSLRGPGPCRVRPRRRTSLRLLSTFPLSLWRATAPTVCSLKPNLPLSMAALHLNSSHLLMGSRSPDSAPGMVFSHCRWRRAPGLAAGSTSGSRAWGAQSEGLLWPHRGLPEHCRQWGIAGTF